MRGRRCPSETSDNKITALHESAHAIVALRCGFELRDKVTIEPTSEYRGWCGTRTRGFPSIESAFRDAVVSLAGPAAQVAFAGHSWLRAELLGGHVDIEDARNGAAATEFDLVRLQRIASMLVRFNGSEIRALAQRLIQERTLTAAEVTRAHTLSEPIWIRGMIPKTMRPERRWGGPG